MCTHMYVMYVCMYVMSCVCVGALTAGASGWTGAGATTTGVVVVVTVGADMV